MVKKLIANPIVILREEFDDWAVLFNPDTGRGFGLNPTGVYVWKLLDGEYSVDDLLTALRQDVLGVPPVAGEHLVAFVKELTDYGLTVYEGERGEDDRAILPPCPTCVREKVPEAMKFIYAPPHLVDFGRGQIAYGDCLSGSHDSGNCQDGGGASGGCWSGPAPGNICLTGTSAGNGCLCTGNSPGWASACWAGNCPHVYSQTCTPGGQLCNNGGSADGCTTCGPGGRGF